MYRGTEWAQYAMQNIRHLQLQKSMVVQVHSR